MGEFEYFDPSASAELCIGEPNAYVYGDLIGITDTEIATCTAQGIFH